MSQIKKPAASRPIGKGKVPVQEKKPIIDPKYKSFFNTIIFIIIMLIFFIVNNTRQEPEKGPYPPYYNPQTKKTVIP